MPAVWAGPQQALSSQPTSFCEMGNWSSQFVGALRNGDVGKASELYLSKAQLRSGLQPNQALGPDDNTYLHHSARLGMAQMYQDLIVLKGKPDMKNAQRRNCIHLICLQPSAEGHSAGGHYDEGQVKREMLEYTLKEGLEGMDLRHLLAEKDEVSWCFCPACILANVGAFPGWQHSPPLGGRGWPDGLCGAAAQQWG